MAYLNRRLCNRPGYRPMSPTRISEIPLLCHSGYVDTLEVDAVGEVDGVKHREGLAGAHADLPGRRAGEAAQVRVPQPRDGAPAQPAVHGRSASRSAPRPSVAPGGRSGGVKRQVVVSGPVRGEVRVAYVDCGPAKTAPKRLPSTAAMRLAATTCIMPKLKGQA